MDSMEEIEKKVAEAKSANYQQEETLPSENLPAVEDDRPVALDELTTHSIKVTLDKSKSYEKQAEDFAGAMATSKAIQDEKTMQKLADEKSEELSLKATTKKNEATAEAIDSETEIQKARRKLYEAVLEDFGIKKHLPQWLMVIMVVIFTPPYILKTVIVGVPAAVIITVVDRLDHIICRYEDVDDHNKPKMRVSIIVLLALVCAGGICLTLLKCFNII